MAIIGSWQLDNALIGKLIQGFPKVNRAYDVLLDKTGTFLR